MDSHSLTHEERKLKLRACQLEILDETLRVLAALDIPYFASHGTLIGACRHQGYIPWDDDIDLWIFPQDYLRFLEQAPQAVGDRFYVQSHLTNVHNIISWARIGLKNTTSISERYRDNKGEWGICLDIFPLIPTGAAGSACNDAVQKKVAEYTRLCRKYDYLLDAKHGNLVRKVYSHWQARESDEVNLKKCKVLIDDLFAPPTDAHTHYLCVDVPSVLYRRETVETSQTLPKPTCTFEGRTLAAPADIDAVLTVYYGDWKTPPPVEERINHTDHSDMILSFDTPWTEYLHSS